MKLKVFDIVKTKPYGDFAQIEKVTTTHGRLCYLLDIDNQEWFEKDLTLVAKAEDRKDDYLIG